MAVYLKAFIAFIAFVVTHRVIETWGIRKRSKCRNFGSLDFPLGGERQQVEAERKRVKLHEEVIAEASRLVNAGS